VARGEAPLGVVYATDARVEKAVKVLATFPAGSLEPVVYPVAITAASKQAEAATFLAFLKGPAARAVFERAGFPVLVP
jgi:molybdate transport system substrate-binding protein